MRSTSTNTDTSAGHRRRNETACLSFDSTDDDDNNNNKLNGEDDSFDDENSIDRWWSSGSGSPENMPRPLLEVDHQGRGLLPGQVAEVVHQQGRSSSPAQQLTFTTRSAVAIPSSTADSIASTTPLYDRSEQGMAAGVTLPQGFSTSTRSTLHNDPDVRPALQSSTLRGSTLLLANYLSQRRDRGVLQKRNSSSGTLTASEGGGDFEVIPEQVALMRFPIDATHSSSSRPGAYGAGFLSNRSHISLLAIPSLTAATQSRSAGNCLTNLSPPLAFLPSGSLQQGVIAAISIALVNGVACWLYYEALDSGLDFVWRQLPTQLLDINTRWPLYRWLWIPAVCFFFSIMVGMVVRWVGEPGDMAFTVACIHRKAYIPMDHVLPMVLASLLSILAGASLGPEAPLVAICGALAGFVSRRIMGERYRAVARKHTLMGMAGALSAFFGIPLGGSLFALEVNSRFGIEYYEHLSEAIFCGELTLVVFRFLAGLSIKPIWDLGPSLKEIDQYSVVAGGALGLVGGAMAYLFALFHSNLMSVFSRLGLLDNSRAIQRALLGCLGYVTLGLLIPHLMFWSENEYDVVMMRKPAENLPYVWPTSGLLGFEINTPWKSALVGLLKLAAISFSVAGGLRGGFIFPLMFAGGSVGRAIADVTGIHTPIGILCVAAGLNTAITRTVLATPLILAFLPNQPVCIPAILFASLCSLLATSYLTFIKTQICRSDVDHHIFHMDKVNRSSESVSDNRADE